MTRPTITAVTLRLILSISLFVVVAIGIGLFSIANSELTKVASDVSKTVADADASQNTLQTLKTTEQELANKQDAAKRATKIIADSKSYNYQNQIINDLNHYASRAKVSLTNINFSTTDEAATPSPTGAARVIPSGVKLATIAVTLKTPVNYNNLLRFMTSIEQNLTKMQISRVNLSKNDTGGVSSDVLNIEVYVR